MAINDLQLYRILINDYKHSMDEKDEKDEKVRKR
jgi:hypothetical protein